MRGGGNGAGEDMSEEVTASLRVRMAGGEGYYGGGLVDGARILRLFGDLATEITIRLDGDEGLLSQYREVTFTAPVFAGDYIEATARLTRRTRLRRIIEFEAKKVIAARYDLGPSAAEPLEVPVVVCRAVGTTVRPLRVARDLAGKEGVG
jgi:3-aminobutyryl-CoA ammonia-lyase